MNNGTNVNKTAFITGGSRGIGQAVAVQLAKEGYDIGFCYKNNSEAAEQVKKAITENGRRACHKAVDVSDFEQVKDYLAEVENEIGPISVVVNNAGITADNPLIMMNEQAWKSVINTNLNSVYNVCRSAIFGFMKRKNGVIINISSVVGLYGNAAQTNYSAAKAGIIGFSKALAKEVGPYGIRVNVVAPGFIKTDMTKGLQEKSVQSYLHSISLRRFGEAQEVADLVAFLVSEKAGYITGQTIQVDGGIIL